MCSLTLRGCAWEVEQGFSCVHTRPVAAKRSQIEDLCAQSMVGTVEAHCWRIRHGDYVCTFAPQRYTADVGSSLTFLIGIPTG